MGYQALLFCPDEKVARTVTQVLGELEFAVESCAEPFAAVKKLMAEHFDAVVVDCDNDQNATLLFKSARNSTLNQGALAVAVVEGQPGVAKAFRIGANLVLTKPINVEQAKGTLRVARGLLRKGEAAKPPAPGVPAAPAKTSPPAAASSAAKPRPSAPATKTKVVIARPAVPVSPADTQEWAESIMATENAKQMAASSGLDSDSEIIETPSATAPLSSGSAAFGHGAASAPAPAREAEDTILEEPSAKESASKPAAAITDSSHKEATPPVAIDSALDSSKGSPRESAAVPVPTFTFGGSNLPEKSATGGSKKIFLAIAAVALLACVGYFGWTKLQEKTTAPAAASNPTSPVPARIPAPTSAAQVPPPASSAASSPAGQTAAPASATDSSASTADAASPESTPVKDDAPADDSKPSSSAPPATTKPAANSKPAAPPIVLKSGSAKSLTKAPAADTPAPSMDAIAAGGSDGSLSNVLAGDAPKPVLQSMTISQGVSQGLLIKKVQPVYPTNALRMRAEGAVKLMATIGTTGNVTNLKAISGEPLLTQAAMDAVKQWKYKPYLLNGEPVEIQTEVTINFKLPQ
jgi:periplasmic protein TonB